MLCVSKAGWLNHSSWQLLRFHDIRSTVSETMRELIRADEKRKAEDQLDAKLLEGLNSAEAELTAADWSAIRKEALAKVEARKKRR